MVWIIHTIITDSFEPQNHLPVHGSCCVHNFSPENLKRKYLFVIDLVFYINSPSVLLFRLISINIPSLIMFHFFIFKAFLCIPTLHICLVRLCFLPWHVKTYICHVIKTGFSPRQRSWPSTLFFISLVATYMFCNNTSFLFEDKTDEKGPTLKVVTERCFSNIFVPIFYQYKDN